MPPLPVSPYTVDELRDRLQHHNLGLHLLDLVEAFRRREAWTKQQAQDLALACQGRREVPAHFVKERAEALVMGLHRKE